MRAVFAKRSSIYSLTLLAAIISITVASLYFRNPAIADDAGMMPPPPTVEVAVVEALEIRTWAEFSGRLSAVASAEIKPLVGGTIQQVLFQEGEVVNKGDALFVIDPRPHQAAVNRAEAQVEAARAQAEVQQSERDRAARLLKDKLISQSQYDQTDSAAKMAVASVAEAKANLIQAQLNLEYAHIKAPVTGRISRAEITVGNVVEAGANAPILASIVAHDQLYAEFDVDEQTYIRYVRQKQANEPMPVQLTLDADQSVAYKGELFAFDNRLNTVSGTIRARAIFSNVDGALTPGMFARINLGSPGVSTALLVPERAVGTNQSKKFVYVVDDNNAAQYREIELGSQWSGYRIIAAGLTPGDRVIVNGVAHVRPNSPVSPVETELNIATTRF